jgi:hypothetical protein
MVSAAEAASQATAARCLTTPEEKKHRKNTDIKSGDPQTRSSDSFDQLTGGNECCECSIVAAARRTKL